MHTQIGDYVRKLRELRPVAMERAYAPYDTTSWSFLVIGSVVRFFLSKKEEGVRPLEFSHFISTVVGMRDRSYADDRHFLLWYLRALRFVYAVVYSVVEGKLKAAAPQILEGLPRVRADTKEGPRALLGVVPPGALDQVRSRGQQSHHRDAVLFLDAVAVLGLPVPTFSEVVQATTVFRDGIVRDMARDSFLRDLTKHLPCTGTTAPDDI